MESIGAPAGIFDSPAENLANQSFVFGRSKEFCNSIHPKVGGDGCMVPSLLRYGRKPGRRYCYVVNCRTNSLGAGGRHSSVRKRARRSAKTARGFQDPGMPQLLLNESPIDWSNPPSHGRRPGHRQGRSVRTRYHEQWIGGVVLLIR